MIILLFVFIVFIVFFYICSKEELTNIKPYNTFKFLFTNKESLDDIYLINNKTIPDYEKIFIKNDDYNYITNLLNYKLSKFLNINANDKINIRNIYNIYQNTIDTTNTEYIFNIYTDTDNNKKNIYLVYLNYNNKLNDIIVYSIKTVNITSKYKEYNNIDNHYIIKNSLFLMYPFLSS